MKLGEYKGIEVEDETATVTDEDVEEEMKRLQESQAELVLKEEGSIEEGNTAVIDFEGFLDGEAFEGGKAENHSLEIGAQQFIPGFEEQLVGKESGEETEIKEKDIPELDDDFAKDVDEEVDSLEALKEKKKDELLKQKEQEIENNKRETLLNKVTENVEVDIPKAMVDTELDQMLKEFEQRL